MRVDVDDVDMSVGVDVSCSEDIINESMKIEIDGSSKRYKLAGKSIVGRLNESMLCRGLGRVA